MNKFKMLKNVKNSADYEINHMHIYRPENICNFKNIGKWSEELHSHATNGKNSDKQTGNQPTTWTETYMPMSHMHG